jgi:phosphopantetheinyl transferase
MKDISLLKSVRSPTAQSFNENMFKGWRWPLMLCHQAGRLVTAPTHRLSGHANRTEAEEAGRPELPVRNCSIALDVSISIAL